MIVPRRVPALATLIAIGWVTTTAVPATQDPPRRSVPTLPPHYALRGEDGLVRAYDFILEARFDQVDAELRRACGPAPAEACNVLDATAMWWRIQLDPESHALDAAFTASVERAIRTTEAWTERAPDAAEAWFYLGAAYGARVQWRVLRGEKVAAARDGKRIKEVMDRAIALEPGMDDAYFGLGMYKYYADVAPAAARVLRFLLLLPGGDRKEGLREMLRARSIVASLDTWRQLLAAAREQRANNAPLAETQARLGMARMLDRLYLTDDALEHLKAVTALKSPEPYSSLALAYLQLGESHDRLGARPAAVAAYKSAIAAVPALDPYDVRAQASKRLRHAPDPRHAEAFRLSLEGWRRLERNDLPGATTALERAIALNPHDPVARYRLGRVLQARREDAAALAEFDLAIRNGHSCPAPILGNAHLEAARLHERLGHKDDAVSGYRIASTLFGAAADTRAAATRALARLDLR
jgi:tetratricopeptide (TPR) repeat protein